MINKPDLSKRTFVLTRLFNTFIRAESSGGMIMISFALLAILAANSQLAQWYGAFVNAPIKIGIMTESLSGWVKDVLMVLFFLTVGMELKREMVEGLLSQKGQVLMPFFAAIGGMLVPALIFTALNYSSAESIRGWAIPSATDIAFALCILMMFGKSIPSAVKILLLAIAIFDDLGAIIIIALFYNTKIALIPMLFTAGGLVFWPCSIALKYLPLCPIFLPAFTFGSACTLQAYILPLQEWPWVWPFLCVTEKTPKTVRLINVCISFIRG